MSGILKTVGHNKDHPKPIKVGHCTYVANRHIINCATLKIPFLCFSLMDSTVMLLNICMARGC